jgi:CRP-like cAMP-binding protein
MALPAQQVKLATTQTTERKLKKGELLFAEGENSRAMYFIKSGMLRLYKKKGDSNIELDTIRAGSVLGELAFLDGNPRSASAEALTECTLVEVSGSAFQNILLQMPEWLKIMLKTVVGRLRTASTRIRQLESASTAFDYSDKSGKRSQHYVYLSPTDVLKIGSGLLLVAARNPINASAGGIEIRVGLLSRYVNQIMGIPVAKITTFLDVLGQTGIVTVGDEATGGKTILKDIDFLESLITYLNEENLVEPSKRHDISIRGFVIMSLIAKYIKKFPKDPRTNMVNVNLAQIITDEAKPDKKDAFRMEEFPELVKFSYATGANIKSQTEIYTQVDEEPFLKAYRLQRVVLAISAVNEQKRRAG